MHWELHMFNNGEKKFGIPNFLLKYDWRVITESSLEQLSGILIFISWINRDAADVIGYVIIEMQETLKWDKSSIN